MKKINLINKQYGDGQRLLHQENELMNTPLTPNSVEYEDIDISVINFFDEKINISDDNGNKIPIFKLLSNQRFSEYSQTWEHTDEDGNLLTNFKTINREINPNWGTIHGGMSNIPGNRKFTVLMREIIDDTGVECYEITSMTQPLSVDLIYTLTFVTTKFELINEFNTKIIDLFKSKQCYVYPNGHAMPMLLENINDESNYEIDGRKFYNQVINFKLLSYIIPKDSIKVELKPKRKPIKTNMDKFLKTYVDMEYDDNGIDFKLNVRLNPYVSKVSFQLYEKVKLSLDNKYNANKITVKVNDDVVNSNDNIFVNELDDVNIKIIKPSPSKYSQLIFKGKFLTEPQL